MPGGTSGLGEGRLWNWKPRPHSSPGVLGAGNQYVTRISLRHLLPQPDTGIIPSGCRAPRAGGLVPRPLCLLPPHLPPLAPLPEASSFLVLPWTLGDSLRRTPGGPSQPHIITLSKKSCHRGKGTCGPTTLETSCSQGESVPVCLSRGLFSRVPRRRGDGRKQERERERSTKLEFYNHKVGDHINYLVP